MVSRVSGRGPRSGEGSDGNDADTSAFNQVMKTEGEDKKVQAVQAKPRDQDQHGSEHGGDTGMPQTADAASMDEDEGGLFDGQMDAAFTMINTAINNLWGMPSQPQTPLTSPDTPDQSAQTPAPPLTPYDPERSLFGWDGSEETKFAMAYAGNVLLSIMPDVDPQSMTHQEDRRPRERWGTKFATGEMSGTGVRTQDADDCADDADHRQGG